MRAVVMALLALASPARAAIVVGPYVQDARPDGFTVVFETDVAGDAAVSVDGKSVATSGTRHEARLDGLKPSTRYHYRVTSGATELAAGDTTTAPDGPHPFTFVVFGDTRDGPEVEQAVTRAALAEAPELALHTGDLVPAGGDAAAWPEFLNGERALLSVVPLYPTAGNHELYGDAGGENFRRWFVLPDGGRETRRYAFRWGNARFVVLDANAQGDAHADETRWLERTLAAPAVTPGPTFVLMHQPPLSMGGHCGAGLADADWVALFERYHVRAVFAGHDHSYQRLERNGVRYFVTGGGGAKLYPERDSCPAYDQAARRVYSAEHHYLRVRVSGDRVEVAALRPSGPPIETVTLDELPVASVAAPPLDVAGSPPPRRWPLFAFTIALVAVVGGRLLRRRWSR